MVFSALMRFWNRLLAIVTAIWRLPEITDQLLFNEGLLVAADRRREGINALYDSEFKVFSQWGEDGILQYLTRTVPVANPVFIEIGVEDFSESNCRFLMMKDNWRGFVVDSSERNIERLRQSWYFWRYDLNATTAVVTAKNAREIVNLSGFGEEVGILSIDIDRNDYWVLRALSNIRASILVCEYNAVFGPERAITIPYDERFSRASAHQSNLYFGASLQAITNLAQSMGYALIGTNSAGCNAFYIRRELLGGKLAERSVKEAFVESRFRESRDGRGKLNFLSGRRRCEALEGMPVFNTVTGQVEAM